ncbi:MAG: ribonuclease HI [Alphaproteobacteria bacterium]|jgi:ribonuclease HI|nr:ribonuclease HI [Alphaproteobacteria bacterium]MBP9877947.1 ribonuclease HI [Alphaproteobacteria bacterium]
MSHNRVQIYTDGACSGNPGPGGWGAILRYKKTDKEISGFEENTTNNRMELTAAIKALESLKRKVSADLYTDSEYVRQGMLSWLPKWKAKCWRLSGGGEVKNRDLWERLDALCQEHDVTFHWIKGHAGHPENERADQLARSGVEAYLEQMKGSD